jgi:xanthine dehydrogenase accessory factor
MASGVAVALYRAGYRAAVVEIEYPRTLRRTVAFAEAIYTGTVRVEGIEARRCMPAELPECWAAGMVPVVADPQASVRHEQTFDVLIDAIMSKVNAGGTRRDWAPLVIGLGPGFVAGRNCHLVVETRRGHYLGRFYDRGTAQPDSGEPGPVAGHSHDRVIRAPVAGRLEPLETIGTSVKTGDLLARIGGTEVRSPLSGCLRGLMAPGLDVSAGEKIGDVDPRDRPEYCQLMSEKARHIGSAVLAAMLWWQRSRPGPLPTPPSDL